MNHPFNVKTATVNTATFITLKNISTTTGFVPAGAVFCTVCHSATTTPIPHVAGLTFSCNRCHTSATGVGGTGDAHQIQGLSCVGCHAVGQALAAANLVNDNNGVRAIIPEFGKTSHHIVNANGAPATDEQCAVCHLEGGMGTYGFGVDSKVHMVDGKIHLRNGGGVNFAAVDNNVNKATTAANGKSEFAWDPATPDHQLMDQFCMSCHNANGAPNALAALGTAAVPGQTALNPFGDTISNGYDQMSRGSVVAVFEQFDTTNSSHHAVRGQKFTTRARTAAGIWNQYSSATSPGSRHTLVEKGMFTSYTPLGPVGTAVVGDDSVIHCGDCHTVGQFKPASTTDSNGNTANIAVIGAHGSVNEYMLRNAYGSDALHYQDGSNGSTVANGTTIGVQATGGNYVCYLCHNINTYGSNRAHNGIDSGNNCNGYGVESVGLLANGTGAAKRVPGIGAKGNVFGMTCTHCHTAGQQGFGGIHGNKGNYAYKAYSGVTDATGNSFGLVNRQPYRFMGGMSLRYNGGNQPSTGRWEQKTLNKTSHDGCYNLTTAADTPSGTPTLIRLWGTNTTANANINGNGSTSSVQNDGTAGAWGACGHHTGSTTAGNPTNGTRTIQRPLSY